MLINKKAVKEMALECARLRFGHEKFTRVSKEFLREVDRITHNYVIQLIGKMETIGKTIK